MIYSLIGAIVTHAIYPYIHHLVHTIGYHNMSYYEISSIWLWMMILSAQSHDSVPPAPAVIWSIALIESSFLLNIILNSISSTDISNSLNDVFISASLTSLLTRNSLKTIKSSYWETRLRKSDNCFFRIWIFLTVRWASLGFDQKSAADDSFSKLIRVFSFDSASKIPP